MVPILVIYIQFWLKIKRIKILMDALVLLHFYKQSWTRI